MSVRRRFPLSFVPMLAAGAATIAAALLLWSPTTSQTAEAQQPPGQNFCSDFILQALETLDDNCNAMDRNSACYGNFRLSATFLEEVESDFFSRPADRADLVQLQSLSTDPLNPDAEEWGIALINAQANLPGALPGQAVTFLLMGEATVVNAVSPEQAALPFDPIEVTTSAQAAIRTQPRSNANLAGSAPAAAVLGADAIDPSGQWVRVIYDDPADDETPALGGWVLRASLAGFDSSILPVVDSDTVTPMQSFIFRTGLGRPVCDQAPNQVIVQGPTNTQVNLTVNGADIVVGSTIGLQSVQGAPQDIIDELDLPDDIIDRLTDGSGSEATDEPGSENSECAVMQLTVINGEAYLNDDELVLPEGNKAFAVSCGLPPSPDPDDPEATQEPGSLVDELLNQSIDFASDWGAPQVLTEEELFALLPLENITTDNINYEIDIPDLNEITPAYTNTPTPTPTVFVAPVIVSTPTAAPTGTPTFTPSPLPPGTGQPATGGNLVGGGQVAVVGQPFPNPFSVTVYDPYGAPVSNVPVTFTAPNGGASGTFAATGTNTQTVMTTEGGTATSSTFTPNTQAGPYAVIATAPSNLASAPSGDTLAKRPAFQSRVVATFSVANAASQPTGIVIVSGDGQFAQAMTSFAQPLVARVVDQFGNGVPGVEVSFNIDYYAPLIFPPESNTEVVTTDSAGNATSPIIAATFAESSGQYPVYAYPSGLEASAVFTLNVTVPPTATFTPTLTPSLTPTFTLTPTPIPGVGSGVVTSGNNQTIIVQQVGSPVTMQIFNTLSQPMDGVTVDMTATNVGIGGYGVVNWSGVTSGGGFVTTPNLYGTCLYSAFSISVTADGVPVDSVTGDILYGSAESVQLLAGDNQTVFPGETFDDLAVRVTDVCNNPIPGANVEFSGPALSGAGIDFGGGQNVTTAATDGTGVVAVGGTATGTPGNFQVDARVNGTAPATVFFLSIQLPALNVTSLADSGPGTLRNILAAAPPGSTITFSVTGTITVSSVLNIDKDITISGPGSGSLTVSGGGTTRVFANNGFNVNVSGLAISGGNAAEGGGFYNTGTLSLSSVNFTSNTASSVGAGIYNAGALTVSGVSFSGNTAPEGSGIYSAGSGTIGVSGSVFFTNTGQALTLLNGGMISNTNFVSNTGRGAGVGGTTPATFTNVEFQGNSSSPFDGGGLYVAAGSTANVNSSRFISNNALTTTEFCCAKGGAIFVEGTLNVTGTSFRLNSAGNNAGAVMGWVNAVISITGSCIIDNADGSNIAIQNASGTTANLTGNWWGDPGGPGANGANGVTGNVNTSGQLGSPPGFC